MEDRPPNDMELIARAKRGELEAYEEIVRRHGSIAFRTALVITGSAEELAVLDGEAHVVQGLEAVTPERRTGSKHTLLQRVSALVRHDEALGHVVDDHGRGSALGGTHAGNGTGGFTHFRRLAGY